MRKRRQRFRTGRGLSSNTAAEPPHLWRRPRPTRPEPSARKSSRRPRGRLSWRRALRPRPRPGPGPSRRLTEPPLTAKPCAPATAAAAASAPACPPRRRLRRPARPRALRAGKGASLWEDPPGAGNMAASSRAQVLRLYRALLRESQRFSSYNYRCEPGPGGDALRGGQRHRPRFSPRRRGGDGAVGLGECRRCFGSAGAA